MLVDPPLAGERASCGRVHARSHIESARWPGLPPHCGIVSVLDGHPATLAWLGAVYGHKVRPAWAFTRISAQTGFDPWDLLPALWHRRQRHHRRRPSDRARRPDPLSGERDLFAAGTSDVIGCSCDMASNLACLSRHQKAGSRCHSGTTRIALAARFKKTLSRLGSPLFQFPAESQHWTKLSLQSRCWETADQDAKAEENSDRARSP